MKTKRAARNTFDSKNIKELAGKLEKRFGPRADLVLNQISRRIAPAVAKVHQWCEQRNLAAPAIPRKRIKKPGAES